MDLESVLKLISVLVANSLVTISKNFRNVVEGRGDGSVRIGGRAASAARRHHDDWLMTSPFLTP